jgi:ribosome-binding protein aMBF1 (putative translation factor)
MAYSHQDWKTIKLHVKQQGNGQSEKDVRRALQNGGTIETSIKTNVSTSKKFDDNRDDFHHKTISKTLADSVRNKRIELQLTQVQLAQRINEKINVIQDIEGMNGVYNHVIVNKTLKALGLSLKQIGL